MTKFGNQIKTLDLFYDGYQVIIIVDNDSHYWVDNDSHCWFILDDLVNLINLEEMKEPKANINDNSEDEGPNPNAKRCKFSDLLNNNYVMLDYTDSNVFKSGRITNDTILINLWEFSSLASEKLKKFSTLEGWLTEKLMPWLHREIYQLKQLTVYDLTTDQNDEVNVEIVKEHNDLKWMVESQSIAENDEGNMQVEI